MGFHQARQEIGGAGIFEVVGAGVYVVTEFADQLFVVGQQALEHLLRFNVTVVIFLQARRRQKVFHRGQGTPAQLPDTLGNQINFLFHCLILLLKKLVVFFKTRPRHVPVELASFDVKDV